MVLFAPVSSIVYYGEIRGETLLMIAVGLTLLFLIFFITCRVSSRLSDKLIVKSRLLDAPMIHLMIVGLSMAILSTWFGLSPLVGAYLVGLAMSRVVKGERILGFFQIISLFFFVYAGILLDPWSIVSEINIMEALGAILSIVAAGITGKIIGCGGTAYLTGMNHKSSLTIGVGMMPRVEVDLVITVVGLTTGVLTMEPYLSVLILIYTTSLTTPVLLAELFKEPET